MDFSANFRAIFLLNCGAAIKIKCYIDGYPKYEHRADNDRRPLHHGLEPMVRRACGSQKASAVGGRAGAFGRIGIEGDAQDGIKRVEESLRAVLPEDIGERIDVGLR